MQLRSILSLLAGALMLAAILIASHLSPVRAAGQSAGKGAAQAAAPNLQATPTPIFFGDFDAAANGFGFQNYGANFPEGDLTIAEVQEMFGNQVCSRLDGATCIPAADAQLWVDTMNQYMADGHCNGFTVMSNRLFAGQFTTAEFSAAAQSTFQIDQSAPIMRRIAQNWTQQATDEILNAEFWGTPQEVIDALQETTELVELKLYYGNAGHSMLAYGLQEMGDGLYHILIYDNNWPGRTDLYVEVSYPANSWQYSLAALNPDTDSDVWRGNSKDSPPNMVFIPLSAYDQKLTCPFCTAAGATTPKTTGVNLTGAGDFLVRDAQGRYSGIWAGAAIGNIPNSRLRRFVGAPSNKAAQVSLPADQTFTTQIGNTGLAPAEPGDLRIVNPDFSAALDDLVLAQNCTEALTYSAPEQFIAYAATSAQKPVLKMAVQNAEGADYLFVLAGVEFQPKQDLKLEIDPDNGLVLTSDNLSAENATLVMARLGATGETVFATDQVVIQGGGAVALDYASWNGLNPLNMQVDADGDGQFEQAAPLENAFPQAPVAGAASGDALITILNEIAPYMDQTDKVAFLDALAATALDGDDMGRLLLALDELQVSDDELAAFLVETTLPALELAEAIHEVRRDADSRAALLAQLSVPDAQKTAIQDELQALDEVHKVLVDVDFLNPDRHERAAAIAPFIIDHGLDPHQIGNLIERLAASGDLLETEVETLIGALNPSPEVLAVIRSDLPASAAGAVPTASPAVAEAGATIAQGEAPTPTPLPPTPTAVATPAEAVPTPTVAAASPTPTLALVAAAAPLSFEPFGNWRRGDQPYGTFTQSGDCAQDDSAGGQLDYDFSAATAEDDFVIFTQRIPLSGEPSSLQVWVYGDGSGHLFNIWIEDANGEVWSVPMGAVTHSGWQQMTGAIDPNAPWPGGRVYGPENGAIDYPIRFLGIVVDRTDGPAAGSLCFDNMTAGIGDPSSARTGAPAPPSTQPDPSDPCANIPAPSADYEVEIRFVNAADGPAIVFWVNFDNQLSEIVRLNPGETHDEESFVTHHWIIQNAEGATVAEYTNSDALTQCVRIAP
ncbi:MAG: hypothetical protein H6641_01830 [Caldilineaceae bacterium]|nr:hypothetical protein [Caldilineaceae bacterium]